MPKITGEKKDAFIITRIKGRKKEQIINICKESGMGFSEWIREAIEEKLKKELTK